MANSKNADDQKDNYIDLETGITICIVKALTCIF